MVSLKDIVIPDPATYHKGSAGRVLIIGGSEEYVGAPYYATMTAMRCGIDIAYVVCLEEAVIPLKTLLPEAIVASAEPEDFDLAKYSSRSDAVCIGSGLGRSEKAQLLFDDCLYECEAEGKILVLDGDALWHLANELKSDKEFLKKKKNLVVVLTPNVSEWRTLAEALEDDALWDYVNEKSFIMRKGPTDVIITKGPTRTLGPEFGTARRFGGQGDLLAGAICAAMAFTSAYKRRAGPDSCVTPSQYVALLKAASAYVRMCARDCGPGEGVIASDVLVKMRGRNFSDSLVHEV
eukprot:Protomagalhaensia_sp_Gyna_25__640@NODE_12_length_8628_cov_38_763069_g8_i0_p4_GENE_NODE_12_length_8628_cov_38_763069_g8_i0NODE_12_length_8628_cov_38_763069_g8_i0_p4_ORF_typecomplete_len293_score52_52Carb_kinase/PF01256_17/2_6e46Phos_pyr_kin/PF08543_12/0_038HK/PF02110_15/0_74_NODE_12_length_8628_cov_38_763069_g8_i056256503